MRVSSASAIRDSNCCSGPMIRACDATWIAKTDIPVVNYGPDHLANADKSDEAACRRNSRSDQESGAHCTSVVRCE